MTQDQRTAFEVLHKHRLNADSVFQDPAFAGIMRTLADMYAGKAHFVFELLQNADDACAKNAWFDLSQDHLVFRHDGRPFSLTIRPDETGDVNAITSVGLSNKDTNSIGKFGIGFKAVFLYTESPFIYTRDFSFRIERYIVPTLVETVPKTIQHQLENGQTVFDFPFDDDCRDEAQIEIEEQLFSLGRPMLFLNHLHRIHVSSNGRSLVYSYNSNRIKSDETGSVLFEKVVCKTQDSSRTEIESFVKASRIIENGLHCSVAFAMSNDWKCLHPCSGTAYCFFPTHDDPKLNFLVHAPFLVTNNRGNIQENPYNAELIDKLGVLSATTLVFLRDWGVQRGIPIIDDSIFQIIPTTSSDFYYVGYGWENHNYAKLFAPIFEKVFSCMKTQGMLLTYDSVPLEDRYVKGNNAYWAKSVNLPKVIDNALLAELVGNSSAKWVFTTSGRSDSDSPLRKYKDSLTAGWFSIVDQYFDDRHGLIELVTPQFLARRSHEWLTRFYLCIQEHVGASYLIDRIKGMPLFLGQDDMFHSATKEGAAGIAEPCLFFPTEEVVFPDLVFLHSDLLNDSKTIHFFRETLKISEPSIRDVVFNNILPKYRTNGSDTCPMDDIKIVLKAWIDGNCSERSELESAIRETEFFCSEDGMHSPASLYFPSEDLRLWFDGQGLHFLSEMSYKETLGERYEDFHLFAEELGVSSYPRIIERDCTKEEVSNVIADHGPFEKSTSYPSWKIGSLDGFESVLSRVVEKRDRALSVVLWKTIVNHLRNKRIQSLDQLFWGRYLYFYHKRQCQSFPSPLLERLQNEPWLEKKDGTWVAPNATSVFDLESYGTTTIEEKTLISGLGISEARPSITPEQEAKLKESEEVEQLLAPLGVSVQQLILFLKQPGVVDLLNSVKRDPIENLALVPAVYTWPKIDFSAVFSWWNTESAEQLTIYNESLYGIPDAKPLHGNSRKSAWMELLILGACHTLGGFQLEAHRGFIHWMKSNGFWSIICNDPVPPQNWIHFLDQFLDSNEISPEFSYWMRLFPRIYQFSRHWREYKNVFLWWNDPEMVPKSVEDLSAFQTNPLLQQTGIKAPGLQKALGTVGIHFVFRELVRRGAIKNPSLAPFCFVPYQGLCARLGVEQSSQAIHSLVAAAIGEEIASFGNAFDIAISAFLRCHT